jgi:hypothetical protein
MNSRTSGPMWQCVVFIPRIAPTASGVTLLFAATAKVASLWIEPNYNMLVFGSKALTVAFLHLEVIFGIGLLLRNSRALRRVALFLHVVFLIYSLTSLAAGHDSCGCFGNWTPPTAGMVLINLCLVFALISSELVGNSVTTNWRIRGKTFWTAASGLTVLLSGLILLPIVRLNDSIIDICDRLASGRVTFLRPGEWQGNPLPILDCLEGSVDELSSGQCSVLIYSSSCQECLSVLRNFSQKKDLERKFAAIDLEGQSIDSIRLRHADLVIASVPTLLHLRDGVVDVVLERQQIADFLPELLK